MEVTHAGRQRDQILATNPSPIKQPEDNPIAGPVTNTTAGAVGLTPLSGPSAVARRPQVMGRACGTYPSRHIPPLSITSAVNIVESAAPNPLQSCCLPPHRRGSKKIKSDVQLQLSGTGIPLPPSPASTSRPTFNLTGVVYVQGVARHLMPTRKKECNG